MRCQTCNCENVVRIAAHCSDLFVLTDNQGREYRGYVPTDLGIGGNDDVRFSFCLDCGQIQGRFPIRTNFKELFSP